MLHVFQDIDFLAVPQWDSWQWLWCTLSFSSVLILRVIVHSTLGSEKIVRKEFSLKYTWLIPAIILEIKEGREKKPGVHRTPETGARALENPWEFLFKRGDFTVLLKWLPVRYFLQRKDLGDSKATSWTIWSKPLLLNLVDSSPLPALPSSAGEPG